MLVLMKSFRLLLPLLLVTASALPALAQTDDNSVAQERINRLERDIMLLQRQISRGQPVRAPVGDADLSPDGAAQLEVRLSAMEEDLRAINGKIEEAEFQNRKLSETLEKFQKDTEFRFSEMGGKGPSAYDEESGKAPAQPAAAAAATPVAPAPESGEERKTFTPKTPAAESDTPTAAEHPTGPTTAGDGVLRAPEKESTDTYATPRDLYNYAFRLLNQTKYEESASAFESFTKKYPKDPLIGNAYYWQGETFYIRRDYVTAADSFRQGFEALPTGPKAPDNLLKLAMSLDALGRNKEACVVLQQVVVKFKKSAASVATRAEQERKRIGCK